MMLQDIAKDYAAYLNLDVSSEFQVVQDVIDNMLTRLEELAGVLQMVKLKNSECCAVVSGDISKYRTEITLLSKKVSTINNVIQKLQCNVDILEKQVIKAELDFGVTNENKIKNFLIPFLKRSKEIAPVCEVISPEKMQFQSVLNNFDDNGL